jgi:hypothetical protein
MPRRRTRAEEDAAFGKAIKRRMGQMKMGGKALARRWNYPEYYVKMIIDDGWLPLDVEIAEICKILKIRKRWKGWDVL